MAGYARYTALLDACVLYSIAMTDALISLAVTGLFAAKWTQAIEAEWMAALVRSRPELQGRLAFRRDSMRLAVPDWEVPEAAWKPLAIGLVLPDANDHHVLAAAIAGHVDCIVTTNLKDFPSEAIAEYGVEVIHPDQFMINQWDLDQLTAIATFKRMRARRKKPEETAEGFAQALERHGLPATAQRLRDAAELI